MNAGVYDTPYFSVRYEDHRTITRGITPYFLGELNLAPFDELTALYKLFPDDRLLFLTSDVLSGFRRIFRLFSEGVCWQVRCSAPLLL